MNAAISNPVELPAKKGHPAGMGATLWVEGLGWEVAELVSERVTIQRRKTGRHTRRFASEEEAIRAARRREWVR